MILIKDAGKFDIKAITTDLIHFRHEIQPRGALVHAQYILLQVDCRSNKPFYKKLRSLQGSG